MECPADICAWTAAHHLELNLYKTKIPLFLRKDCPRTVEDITISVSSTARNLGVILYNILSCPPNITAVAQFCRFTLNNFCQIWFLLTKDATQLLVQALVISRLDYCNSLSVGLPASATKPSQLIQNTAVCLVFNLPKFSHVTPFLRDFHWLPVAVHIQFTMMVLAPQGRQWNSTHLPPSTGQTTRPSVSTWLQFISWLAGTAIAESKQRSLSKIKTVLVAPDHCQDNRVTSHLPQNI